MEEQISNVVFVFSECATLNKYIDNYYYILCETGPWARISLHYLKELEYSKFAFKCVQV